MFLNFFNVNLPHTIRKKFSAFFALSNTLSNIKIDHGIPSSINSYTRTISATKKGNMGEPWLLLKGSNLTSEGAKTGFKRSKNEILWRLKRQ